MTQEQSHTQQLGENPSGTKTAGAMPAEAAEHEPSTTRGDPEKTDSLLGGHLKTLSRFKRHE